MIAFLGMGLLGANFAKAMLKKGLQVQVWNRSPEKANALVTEGAKAFPRVADAVSGADTIHITLKDDASVDEVLAQAISGLKPGAILIDHTTTSAAGAEQRTREWKERGFTYLHAPVFMGPQNALDSSGYMLVSGDQEVIAKVEPELAAMTGQILNFGTTVNRAAGMKLVGNLFLVAFTGSVADTLALGKALDIPLEDIFTLFGAWNPGAMLPARIKKMTGNSFDKPTWELAMARKDTQLFLDAAKQGNKQLTVIPAIAAEMDRWMEQGHGKDDWTVIGKDAVS